MPEIPIELTPNAQAVEGEHNADCVKITLSEDMRGYPVYIVRRFDGYGKTSDSPRLYEQDGAVAMPLTEDILRGSSLKLQLIALNEDFTEVAKSEVVTLDVSGSLRMDSNQRKKSKDLLAEMVEALGKVEGAVGSIGGAVGNAEKAVKEAEQAVSSANEAVTNANEAARKANEAAENVQDGADGTTFTPHVDSDGNLMWTNSDGKQNPPVVNIKGEQGIPGERGEQGPQGVPGEKGETGKQGIQGVPGKSAYQYAVDGGYTGTEEEFRELIVGYDSSLRQLFNLTAVLKDVSVPDANESLLFGIPPAWTDPERKLGFYSQLDIGDTEMREWLINLIQEQIAAIPSAEEVRY